MERHRSPTYRYPNLTLLTLFLTPQQDCDTAIYPALDQSLSHLQLEKSPHAEPWETESNLGLKKKEEKKTQIKALIGVHPPRAPSIGQSSSTEQQPLQLWWLDSATTFSSFGDHSLALALPLLSHFPVSLEADHV